LWIHRIRILHNCRSTDLSIGDLGSGSVSLCWRLLDFSSLILTNFEFLHKYRSLNEANTDNLLTNFSWMRSLMRSLLCDLAIVAVLKSRFLYVCSCISTVSPEDTGCVNISLQ
ncbi:hypothetical protein ANCCAN_26620, partial [Ancylostoma caninum]